MSLQEEIQNRIRELVKEEELDEYLPEVEEALPWGLFCSIWASLALISAGVAMVRGEWVVAGTLAVFGVLLIVLSPVTRTASQRRRHRLGRQGRIVPGAIAQVHNNWYRPANEEAQAGMVLVSFDPAADEDGGVRLQTIVSELWELKDADRRTLEGEELRLAWMMYAEIGTARRLRIPATLSHGLQDCWLFSTVVPVAPLRYGETLIYTLMLEDDEADDAAAVLPVELSLPA